MIAPRPENWGTRPPSPCGYAIALQNDCKYYK